MRTLSRLARLRARVNARSVKSAVVPLVVPLLAVCAVLLGFVDPSFAQVPTPVTIDGAAASAAAANTAATQVNLALPTVLAVGGGFIGLRVVWRVTKSFAR